MSRWKLVLAAIAVLLVVLVGYRALSAKKGKAGADEAERPVPVTVVTVAREEVPVFVNALGTVQALNTVTVRPQVGGQIESIHFEEGQQIAKGALIATIDARPRQAELDQVLAKKKQDQAQLAGARSTLKRYDDLVAKGYVSAQDMENQRHSVAQLEALVAADDAAIANARVQLGYTSIRAPIAGLAGLRQVDVGNIVQASQSTGLVVLTQVQPINVLFTLPEQNVDLVRGSMLASGAGTPLAVTALDRTDLHPVAQGLLRVIDNQIDSATGTFKLKAEFANDDNALWPGQFVNVRMQLRTTAGTVVPSQALQRGPDGSYVYRVQDDGTVTMQPVTTSVETADGKVLVTRGVEVGQRIVTEGQFRLKPGAKVTALAPGQAAPVATAPDKAK